MAAPLPFFTRLWFSLVCALRVLADGAFAGRVWAVRAGMPSLAEAPSEDDSPPDSVPVSDRRPDAEADTEADNPVSSARRPREEAALMLLAVLQREGRLLDFIEQDIEDFGDADIGAAARVLHAGCRKALRRVGKISTIRDEDEDSRVTVEGGIDTGEIKLVGAVEGKAPYRGILRHKGWRVALQLPEVTTEHDVSVVAPAEVEL